jgi:raffinose/stachyose/melibiose transport system substrate-binding protein
VEGGKVVPISDIRRLYPDYAGNMKDSMMPVSTSNGRQYAVPVNGYWEGLFVNKRVLADCGIDIPGPDHTWEQFLLDCQVIKDKGYTPIAVSLMDVPHYWFEFCVFNQGSIATHASIPYRHDDPVGRTWRSGLLDIKELYDLGFLPEDTNTVGDGEINFMMINNEAAFMLDGSWKVGWFQANADNISDYTVTYVPAKGERRATDIVGGLSMGYYISKKAWDNPKKREAAVAFVSAMTTDEVVQAFAALSITALKNGTVPPTHADALEMAAIEMTTGCTGIVSAAQDLLHPEQRAVLFGHIPGIVTGEIAPGQAITECLTAR